MITAVIFDMDGLMIDSERVTFEGYKHVLAKHNLTLSLEAYKTLLGKPVKAVYELFHKDYGDDFDVEETIKAVHQYMADLFENEGVPLKEGLIELLKYLKENDYKTEVFLKSCQKLGITPDEALVLEDSESGINAAYSAGIKVICIPDLKYPDHKFAIMTNKIMDNLSNVRDYLANENH